MTSPARTTPPPSRATRALVLVGYFACVAALISALSGTWAVYRRHVALADWPTVAARIDECRLQRYDGLLDATRSSYGLRCRFAYDIAAVHYAVPVRSSFTADGADALAVWIAAHPRGSTLLVRYDPREPAAPSLIGLGIASEDKMPSGPFRGALAFGLAGAVLLVAASATERRADKSRQPGRRFGTSRFPTPPVSMGAVS